MVSDNCVASCGKAMRLVKRLSVQLFDGHSYIYK